MQIPIAMGIGFLFGIHNGDHRACFKSAGIPARTEKRKKSFKFASDNTERNRVNKIVSSARSFRQIETSPNLKYYC